MQDIKMVSTANFLIQPLFDGPLDIVGDVHGEIDALDALLKELGYHDDGTHPQDRRLVFVGDLVDRGPDSPAVLKKVRDLVEAGRAQCVLGNHELNLLRSDEKSDNSWWMSPEKDTKHPMARIDEDEKADLRKFLASLPLALERDELRVVHACWHEESISTLKALTNPGGNAADRYQYYVGKTTERMKENRGLAWIKREWRETNPRLEDPEWDAVMMPAKAALDSDVQMRNPIAVLTSGVELPAKQPFWAGGKWRMVERIKWWEDYDDNVPVIVGHYWRRYGKAALALGDKYGPDLFAGLEPHHWMGKRSNVYCVDFSVGARAEQRASGEDELACKLAAVRFPEWEVVHDDGERGLIGI
jgi:hypothetical protein